ncbi:MAG: hypothetical protein DRJ15_03115 [Bacteroidetes bacterium]|jgi:hypothetical protein|nr:MAG: hypothetical protein DRJ15_03115 [Bacteroidota bacterium]
MKRSIGVLLLIFVLVVVVGITVYGAPPPPGQPPDPPDPGGGDVPIGGSPIAEGVMILISLALGYAGRKLYNARKRKISE